MLERLNKVNDMPIYSVFDAAFEPFGKVLKGYDFAPFTDYLERETDIPQQGNVYVASVPEMEAFSEVERLQNEVYGGMPIQVGYCNGVNSTYNGFEYHKGSEINVAATDFCLVLAHIWQIRENTIRVGEEKVFFVPKGTAIEMYATTLHLSPCRVTDSGFKGLVVLPRGTNTPLQQKPESATGENRLLLQTNKWVISHPEREPLMKQGAFPGLIGENKEIHY